MNGANHLEESDAQPIHLCPVDLRKLASAIGFNVEERYCRLFEFYSRHPLAFGTEVAWLRQRLNYLNIPIPSVGALQQAINPPAQGAAVAATPEMEDKPSVAAASSPPKVYHIDKSLRITLSQEGTNKSSVILLPRRNMATLLPLAKNKLRLRSLPNRVLIGNVTVTDELLLTLEDGVSMKVCQN